MPFQVIVGLFLSLGGLAGLIVSLYFHLDAAVVAAAGLMSTGTALIGKETMPQSDRAAQTYSKRPPGPPSVASILWVVIGIAPLILWLTACTPRQVADVKNVARRVNDVATELCRLTMGAEAAREGISVADLCAVTWVIAPFLQAPREALAAARLGGPLPAREDCARVEP